MTRVEWIVGVAIVVLLGVMCIGGCKSDQAIVDEEHSVVLIDGCQYIVVQNSARAMNNYSFAITHKGDCTNLIHAHMKAEKP